MAAGAAAGEPPEDLVKYLAQLSDEDAAALLARARATREVAPPPVQAAPATTERAGTALNLRAAHGGLCACEDCGVGAPPAPAEARTRPEGPAARDAAESLMHALEHADTAAVGVLLAQADLGHLSEDGWTCLHWAVHTAGGAAREREGAEEHSEHEAGCGCCNLEPRPESRELLRRVLGEAAATGLSVDLRSSDGATPLMFAADAGDREARSKPLPIT